MRCFALLARALLLGRSNSVALALGASATYAIMPSRHLGNIMPSRHLGNYRTGRDRLSNNSPLRIIAPPPAANHARHFRPPPNDIRAHDRNRIAIVHHSALTQRRGSRQRLQC
jgi:hypothetical protein